MLQKFEFAIRNTSDKCSRSSTMRDSPPVPHRPGRHDCTPDQLSSCLPSAVDTPSRDMSLKVRRFIFPADFRPLPFFPSCRGTPRGSTLRPGREGHILYIHSCSRTVAPCRIPWRTKRCAAQSVIQSICPLSKMARGVTNRDSARQVPSP